MVIGTYKLQRTRQTLPLCIPSLLVKHAREIEPTGCARLYRWGEGFTFPAGVMQSRRYKSNIHCRDDGEEELPWSFSFLSRGQPLVIKAFH